MPDPEASPPHVAGGVLQTILSAINSFKKYQKFVPFGCWLVFFASLFALDYFQNKVLISLVLVASLAGFLFSVVVAAIETSQYPKDEVLTKQVRSFLRGDWLKKRK